MHAINLSDRGPERRAQTFMQRLAIPNNMPLACSLPEGVWLQVGRVGGVGEGVAGSGSRWGVGWGRGGTGSRERVVHEGGFCGLGKYAVLSG